jgi:hypothetical protein
MRWQAIVKRHSIVWGNRLMAKKSGDQGRRLANGPLAVLRMALPHRARRRAIADLLGNSAHFSPKWVFKGYGLTFCLHKGVFFAAL